MKVKDNNIVTIDDTKVLVQVQTVSDVDDVAAEQTAVDRVTAAVEMLEQTDTFVVGDDEYNMSATLVESGTGGYWCVDEADAMPVDGEGGAEDFDYWQSSMHQIAVNTLRAVMREYDDPRAAFYYGDEVSEWARDCHAVPRDEYVSSETMEFEQAEY